MEKILKKKRSQNGQALVEFALVAPIFLLLLVGIFEVGRILYTWHVLSMAARDGARLGITELYDNQAIATAQDRAEGILTEYKMKDDKTTLSAKIELITNVEGGTEKALTLSISKPVPFLIWPDIVPLHAQATFRMENGI